MNLHLKTLTGYYVLIAVLSCMVAILLYGQNQVRYNLNIAHNQIKQLALLTDKRSTPVTQH